MFSKVLIFQGFRGIGDCSPWSLGVVFANQEGQFLISFSNFGGRTFSHLLIFDLRIKGHRSDQNFGSIPHLARFQFPEKVVVGLLLRRRPLYPAELRNQNVFSDPPWGTLFLPSCRVAGAGSNE